MSDRGRRGVILGGLLGAALIATPAIAANDCSPLTQNFRLCAEGTPWAGARLIRFGGGEALELEPFYVEFSEHWIEQAADVALDRALDDLLAEMLGHEIAEGMDAPETLLRDHFDTGSLRVERAVKRIDMGDDGVMIMALMIAEGAASRIAVFFSSDEDAAFEDLSQQAQGFVALIHPGKEG